MQVYLYDSIKPLNTDPLIHCWQLLLRVQLCKVLRFCCYHQLQ
jgi:hypothetical protein